MTSKDYVIIAKAIREARDICEDTDSAESIIDVVVEQLITVMSADNKLFSPYKFAQATDPVHLGGRNHA